jgi:hypothetical protein
MATPKDFSPFVPFDLYDFFGYLFPGAIFSVSILLFYDILHPAFYSSWFSYPLNQFDIPFIVGLGLAVAGIVMLYALGHVIATVSHIIIDRVLVDGIEGYPINFLLDIPQPSRPYSQATFKYLFASFNILLLAPVLPINYSQMRILVIALLGLIGALILQRIIIMIIRSQPNGHAFTRAVGTKWYFRILLLPSSALIDPTISFFRKLLGMDRSFSPSFLKLYYELFAKRFGGLQAREEGSDNYWLSAFAAISNDEIHDRTLHMWLHLYGFARNASAALYLSSFLIICHLLFNEGAYTGLVPMQLGIQWVLAAAFGIRYWILYSHYYTKGVIRAFVELQTRP